MLYLNHVVDVWVSWLFHSGWQAAALLVAVLVILAIFRRLSAQFRYALLLIALAKFAMPPFLSFATGIFSQGRAPLLVDYKISRAEDRLATEFPPDSGSSTQSLTEGNRRYETAIPALRNSLPSSIAAGELAGSSKVHWFALSVALIHAVGVVFAAAITCHKYSRVRKLVLASKAAPDDILQIAAKARQRLRIRGPSDVRVSEACDAPFATGVLKPVIVLPRGLLKLPQDQLQIILGHELAHIRRHDLIVGWGEIVLGIVWWFHPGMWWLKRELRASREDCCDDALLTDRLATPVRYCETLIDAAARQTFRLPEPVALGFSNGEHPAARRIRRLMDGTLFRTRRLRWMAFLFAFGIGLVVLPGAQPPRAPVEETTLEGWMGWTNLPFNPDREELVIIKECEQLVRKYRSTYERNGLQIRRFDDPETRDKLIALLARKPDFFYPKHLLGTWYRRNGDAAAAQELFSKARSEAPTMLTQRYRTGDGRPLPDATIETMEIECNQVRNHSLDPSLKLTFIDLITDDQGEISLPVYSTVYRLTSRSYPTGYDTEMPRLGWFRANSRTGVLPEITAWASFSRPATFTRTARESAILAEAKGTSTDAITLGANEYKIARVARCQSGGQWTERPIADGAELAPLPPLANSAYMDHAVIDMASPDVDHYEIGQITALDSKTKIPLRSFQAGAGVKIVDKSRFHLYALGQSLPAKIDLVLSLRNFEPGAFRMRVPAESSGTYVQGDVTFTNEHLGAGQHDGWSSVDGFYKEAKKVDFLSEMLFRVRTSDQRRYSLLVIKKDGQRIDLEAISPLARIPCPLAEIDHFELVPNVSQETIYFENITLPDRRDAVDRELPQATFSLTGVPETFSSDAFEPIKLRCTTKEGDAYQNASFSGPFGWGLDDQEPGKRDEATKSTIIVESSMPAGVRMSYQYMSRGGNAALQSSGGMSMSGPWGSAACNNLYVPLTDVGSVKVRLEPVLSER